MKTLASSTPSLRTINFCTATASAVLAFVLASNLLLINSANAGKLYKWVDANGNISYQDQPPPKNANVLRESSIDENGSLSDKVEQQAVTVYTVPNCAACSELLSRLVEIGVPVEEQNLDNNRDAQQRVLELSDSLIAPTVVINGRALPNPNLQNLNEALETAGYKIIKPKPKFVAPPRNPDSDLDDRGSEDASDEIDNDQFLDQESQPAG